MDQAEHTQPVLAKNSPILAGFWLRAAAALIDSVVMLVVMFIPFCSLTLIGLALVRLLIASKSDTQPIAILVFIISAGLITIWLYFALMESSGLQATFGKKWLGLYVTDIEGRRLSLARSSARTFAKCLASLTAASAI